jgi:hypothetical protein
VRASPFVTAYKPQGPRHRGEPERRQTENRSIADATQRLLPMAPNGHDLDRVDDVAAEARIRRGRAGLVIAVEARSPAGPIVGLDAEAPGSLRTGAPVREPIVSVSASAYLNRVARSP